MSDTHKTKVQIAAQIKTANILKLQFNQQELQTNFKIIIEALSQHDQDISTNKFTTQKLNQKVTQFEKQISTLIATTAQEKMKLITVDDRTGKNQNLLSDLEKRFQDLLSNFQKQKDSTKTRLGRLQNNVQNPQNQAKSHEMSQQSEKILENMTKLINSHDDAIKELNQRLRNDETVIKNNHDWTNKEIQSLRKQIINISKSLDPEKLKKQFQQIRMLLGDINVNLQFAKIRSQIEKNKQEVNQEIKNGKEDIEKLMAELDQQKRLRLKNSQQLWKLQQLFMKNQSEKLNGDHVNIKDFKDIQKDTQQLKKKMNIIMRISSGQTNNTVLGTIQQKSPYNKLSFTQTQFLQTGQSRDGNKTTQLDIKHQLFNKMKEQKSQLLKAIRKSDLYKGDQDKNKILLLQQRMGKLEHLFAGKADTDALNKLISFLENKLNYLFQLINAKTQDDALLAKKNWFCLSCDKKLQSYRGKIGTYFVHDQLKGKTIQEPEVIGGGMSMRSKSKVELPSVSKSLKK